MKSVWGALGKVALVICCLSMAAPRTPAQKASTPASAQSARSVLADKARALEARGRPDMALQLWQQILLSDPKSNDALAGVARDYKLMGNADKAAEALNRLRAMNPGSPDIARIESLSSTQTQSDQLKQAGVLVEQGKPEEAMRIYRQLYSDQPPNGDIAMAYYQTLYATRNGKDAAVAGLRALAQKNPGAPQYAVALGTVLTYDARTRAEGMRILEAHPQEAGAQAALRQALIWNAANPATAEQLREYLKTHPQDEGVAAALKQSESSLATSIARTPAEQAAFAALNAGRLDDADQRFTAILEKDPHNARVEAGLGFVRMRQQKFDLAIALLTQAEADGYREKFVQNALANSRFWFAMSEATAAFNNNQLDLAQSKYREALTMNAQSIDALNGLAGVLVKQQQYAQAAGVYEQLVAQRPADSSTWRGLFVAYARAGQNDKALSTISRFPAPVRATLTKDVDLLRALAGIYEAQGLTAEAQRVLAQALALPIADPNTLLDTRLQFAGILLEGKQYSDAAQNYTFVLNQNPSSLSAWEGLITAHHNLGQDEDAISDIKRMPASAYESALADPAFLAELGAIYQQANQYEVAQGLLERAEKQQAAAGTQPALDLQLQLAGLYLLRSDPAHAYEIYRKVIAANPENAKAWLGIITALHTTSRDTEALQQIALIPPAVRTQLEANIDFVQIEASIYAGTGDLAHAFQYMRGVENYYAKTNQPVPPDIDLANTWLLYNTGDDRALYAALIRIGSRTDLLPAQREAVQSIWANWAVRRAEAALDNGDYGRAVDILDAARLAFPSNITVSKAVANGYVVVGRGREALTIFKTIPMQDASSGDFQGAIGAALSANDKAQAEIWLRQALERFPHDPSILNLAAQYEQARGDNERAADYYRASLAAMPKVSPTDRLAHALVNPEQDMRPHKAVTADDLEQLLDPDQQPFNKTTKLPPLPAYGPDPYNSVPVPTTPASQQDSKPVVVPIPNGALALPVVNATPVPVSSGGTGAAQLVPSGAPNTLAAQNWKGLLSALTAAGRNAEAVSELNRIPAEIRAELDNDIEFEQQVAGLYLAVGDTARAQPYLSRIGDYFRQHGDATPTAVAIEHVWLLYNSGDDAALYPALLRVDARTDLTAAQQADKQKLWAAWAARRANSAMDRGDLLRGVEILQAAVQDYPTDAGVRRALAGGYARMGRAADAVALYKSFPLASLSAGDLQLAVAAALVSGNLTQADTWLRRGLTAYPRNAQILALASRLERTRGDTQRAAEYMRAATSALAPGESIAPLPNPFAYPADSYRVPVAGATRALLNPALEQVALPARPIVAQQGPPPLVPVTTPAASVASYTGRVVLPPTEENIAATNEEQTAETVSVHPLPNAPVLPPASSPDQAAIAQYSAAQYTPSAQEATTGAYSVPKSSSSQPASQPAPPAAPPTPPPAQPQPTSKPTLPAASSASSTQRRRASTSTQQARAAAPPSPPAPPQPAPEPAPPAPPQPIVAQSAPEGAAASAPAQTATTGQSQPASTNPGTTNSGLSDQELQDRNLPPLRGPWVRTQRQAPPVNPRDIAEHQLEQIESSYSSWFGGTGMLAYRSGDLGYSHLAALEAPFEISAPMGYHARFTLVAKPVFLDSGQADGSANLSVLESTGTGTVLVSIPEPIGTLIPTTSVPPSQQNASGIGGELQLVFPHFAIAGGYTPYGFLTSTFTGRVNWKPADGPITITAEREPVIDSQLSYAGLRDPAGGTAGAKWGGVFANQGELQFGHGDAQSGFYISAGGQYLAGTNVRKNIRIDGTAGAYWRAWAAPEYGTLTIGANFFGMHYGNNQNAFTYGMGGYFSPQSYFLANVPFTWTGHYETHWHYTITGAVGVQAFQEDATLLWPLAAQKSLEAANFNVLLPNFSSISANYDLRSQLAYQLGPHWFAGLYLTANNTRDYNAAGVGFYVRYTFRTQPSTVTAPTGLFPSDGLRPFTVP